MLSEVTLPDGAIVHTVTSQLYVCGFDTWGISVNCALSLTLWHPCDPECKKKAGIIDGRMKLWPVAIKQNPCLLQ